MTSRLPFCVYPLYDIRVNFALCLLQGFLQRVYYHICATIT
ncbi:hypothetical protein HMPREF1580_00260 [Gardnerella vaginalis JCP8070]|nr:hypothetical protein HMPREF1580_00260 [Gardnerella vaginalis JCP8070]